MAEVSGEDITAIAEGIGRRAAELGEGLRAVLEQSLPLTATDQDTVAATMMGALSGLVQQEGAEWLTDGRVGLALPSEM